ncbi:MAG: CHASE2 domain-containing protein, partial [Cyanobacteria bacterium J06592_8]
IALATLSILSVIPSVQYQLLDQRVRVQAIYRNQTGQVPNASAVILLVEIDNASLEEAGLIKPKPISRQYLARLIDRTAQLKFDIVGVDYLLNVDWPEEDPALEKSLAASRSQSETQYIFITSRDSGNERRLTRPQFADREWQGDSRLWESGRYMTLLPLETEERPFPFSYLLALVDTAEDSQIGSLSQTNPILLIDQLFVAWMRPILLTRHSYRHYQYWLHPIVDFSIPQNTIYESISAKDFLAATPEQLQTKYPQSVMMIIPGGYAEAGINRSGEDNFPPPPAFCYWQRQAQPYRPCRIILGGEIHAYLFYHFLKKSAVIPIPDLWLLWLFALIGKSLTVFVKQSEFDHRKVVIIFFGGTVIYGIVSLQLYISGSVLLPILMPTAILWVILIPQLKLRKFQ